MILSSLLNESGKTQIYELVYLVCSEGCVLNHYVKVEKKLTEVTCGITFGNKWKTFEKMAEKQG